MFGLSSSSWKFYYGISSSFNTFFRLICYLSYFFINFDRKNNYYFKSFYLRNQIFFSVCIDFVSHHIFLKFVFSICLIFFIKRVRIKNFFFLISLMVNFFAYGEINLSLSMKNTSLRSSTVKVEFYNRSWATIKLRLYRFINSNT